MTAHDPAQAVARFLADDLDPRRRADFSAHLPGCAACGAELDAARRGRQLAEGLRTHAPADLRERVRALVETEPDGAVLPAPPPRYRRRVALALVGAAAAGLAVVAVNPISGTSEPASLASAVADYSARRLPGTLVPGTAAPDLSMLGLRPVGAGGGTYAGLAVDGFSYRDDAGRDVMVYRSQQPFPEAPGRRLLAGPDGPWIASRGEVVLLCARLPHALLIVGRDPSLVRDAASALRVL